MVLKNIIVLLMVASMAMAKDEELDELKCWLKKENFYLPGLESSEDVNDILDCASKCLEVGFCRAIYIDETSSPRCWYHKSKSFEVREANLKSKQKVTTYLYDPHCAKVTKGVDLNCWDVTPKFQIKGLTNTNLTTLAECLKECKDSGNCSAVGWDFKTNPKCWIQRENLEVSVSKLVPFQSATNFILNKNCLDDVAKVTSSATRSQINELKCWTKTKYTYHPSLDLSESDVIECVTKCRENDFCHVVDVDTASGSPKCGYQRDETLVVREADLKPKETSTNYVYDSTCGKLTAGIDLKCWTVTPKYNIWNLKQVDKATLAECLKACVDLEGCEAVDWDTVTKPKCWIQTRPLEISLRKLRSKKTVTNFLLNRDCLNQLQGLDLSFWRVSNFLEYKGHDSLTPINRTDLKSCLEFCKGENVCNVLDFDPERNPPCWAQTTDFQVERGKLTESNSSRNFFLQRWNYEKYLECEKNNYYK